MSPKPHLFFRNPVEGKVRYQQSSRFMGTPDDPEEEKNYAPMKEVFRNCRETFFSDQRVRIQNRNPSINIPAHLEYIEIHFFDAFNSGKFENFYRARFGLAPVTFKNFNGIVIFAITDNELFQFFINQINQFINYSGPTENPPFDKHILFIKEFYFLSTERIIEYPELKSYVILNMLKNPELFTNYTQPIEKRLLAYLDQLGVEYHNYENNEQIELIEIPAGILTEIIDNFDIIHSVNSYSAGIIRPSVFNTPIREYGFTISNSEDELPIIGIIDTGIDNNTPLAPIIINRGNEFDLTNTSPVLDEANHGSAVALLAALGTRLIPNHIGQFESDAKLLSIKAMNGQSGPVKISEVEDAIRNAYSKYNCKIFTLTIIFDQPLKNNARISEYAYTLDRLAYDLDVLIFIAAGNNTELTEGLLNPRPINYPLHFTDSKRNICSPADSMNNIVIGAVSDNFENNGVYVLSPDINFPASYTRKFNFAFNDIIKNSKRISKHLSKPDIACPGGDVDQSISSEHTGIKVLSTRQGLFYDRDCGTSLSAPLMANLAARIIRTYPTLGNNMQSVKALIINSAFEPKFRNVFKDIGINSKRLIGKGIPDTEKAIFSNDNSATLLLEDTITPGQIQTYQLHIPEYLQNLTKTGSVIEISATICYKFKPVQESHIAYCPVCIAFGFFNNKEINNQKGGYIKLNAGISWSEDYYFGTKILSNCQKITFRLSKTILAREQFVLRLAVNCKLHKLLNQNQKSELNKENPFSLVIALSELPNKGELSGNLYSELEAINNLENIADLEAILDNEA
ncbi:MAG: S8 family serine peptidase [Mariniphaga sp.]|nr:S8 family serine peptidase [Mariniphaga sp.]